MSALHDLVSQVRDEALRNRILEELGKVESKRRFGLVWEDHLVESTKLFGVPIRMNSVVTRKAGTLSERYQVTGLDGDQARCRPIADGALGDECILDVSSLVPVADFGEPIYPCLTEVDRVENAPDEDAWHTLIEADNYHALQLLRYMYPHKVDCIYIDPPFNTGDQDWKYNNDYVDKVDSYRHSKWLSFMEKRLQLAKHLLNPEDSVLLVAIDEREYLHLGMLLEQIFKPINKKGSPCKMQMISLIMNPAGVSRDSFARTNEYYFVLTFGSCTPAGITPVPDWKLGSGGGKASHGEVRWNGLSRTGTHSTRRERPKSFYPIFVSEDGKKLLGYGAAPALEENRNTITAPPGQRVIWPIHSDGSEGCWRISGANLMELYEKGFVKLGRFTKYGMSITYLARGERQKIADGIFRIAGYDENGTARIESNPDIQSKLVPGCQWSVPSHDATQFGTKLTKLLLGGNRFTFPKSLYAVEDLLRFFVASKPEALIVDFFAGSGTSANAVLRLNKQDGGHRRIISVTNNEVGPEDEKRLRLQGLEPGDDEWEALGIARYVTFPRIKAAITGRTPAGDPIKGDYGIKSDQYVEVEGVVMNPETGKPMRGRFYQKKQKVQNPVVPDPFPMSDGFAANAIYFKLGFLDKDAVALGRQFRELLPILWMKAGCHGPCPSIDHEDIPDMLVLPENRMAILVDDTKDKQFAEEIAASGHIDTAYIVTGSPARYRLAAASVEDAGVEHTFQLHEDYLENFQINIGE